MWNKVSLGFDAEEETINFGCRKIAVCDSAVYETNTVAIISQENKDETVIVDTQIPKICCNIYKGTDPGIIVIINESINNFNSFGNELKNQYSFDALIDCYDCTSNGNFLFIALNNGDIYCYALNSNQKCIFLKNICNGNDLTKRTFVNIFVREEKNHYNLILTSYNGNIYILKGVNIADIEAACMSQIKDDVEKLIKNVNEEYVSLCNNEYDYFKISMSSELERFGERFLLIVGQSHEGEEIQLWSENNEFLCSSPLLNKYRLQKIRIIKNGSLIFALTDQGSLLVICSYTLTLTYHYDKISLIDFEIMDDEDNKLLVLTTEPSNMLQLITVPGFNIKFQINVDNKSFLIEKQSSIDDLLYLEACCNEEDNVLQRKVFDSVYLKAITESQPEQRLERILRRGKFEEAEEFARNFNLDVEIVYKSHLQKLLSDIQPWTEEKISVEESGIKFQALLQKVQDIEFVGKCALNAISSNFILIKDILKYAENRIKLQISNGDFKSNKILQHLYSQIRNSLLRLSTFLAVCEKPLTVDKWLHFCKANLIEECQSLLKQGLLNQMMLIWSRHIYQLKNQMTYDQTLYFLSAIPSSLSISQILDWLTVFLPVCLSLFPDILTNLINWCKEKVYRMELLAESDWTESALQFLKKILYIIRINVKPCQISTENIIQSEYGENSPLKDILFNIKILNEINIMKVKYGINVTISEFTQANDEEIIFTILDKVPMEELKSFVDGFFEELIFQKNLNADLLLSGYIRSMVEGSVNWWYWEEAPWEGRVAILIDCVISVEEKLKCILCVLKNSPVPWSDTIVKIYEKALTYKNPLTKLIFEQKKMIECKLILKKYDLKDNTLTKSRIRRIILFIFAQARSTMLEDTLQIANAYDSNMCTDVYQLYVQHLIENKEFVKLLSFLDNDNLSPRILISCCEKIILRTHCLSGMPIFLDKYRCYVEVIDSVSVKLERLLLKLKTADEIPFSTVSPDICRQIKNIFYIKTNYKEDISSHCLIDQRERHNLLQYCLQEIIKKIESNEQLITIECLKLNDLANCFECSAEEICIKFINLAVSENKLNIAVYMLRFLLKEDKFNAKISRKLINLACYILQYCIRNSNIFENSILCTIHDLAVISLDSCSPDLLIKAIEICNWCKLFKEVPVDKEVFNTSSTFASYSANNNCSIILKLLSAYEFHLQTNSMKSSIEYLPNTESTQIPSPDAQNALPQILQYIIEQEQENVCFQLMITLHWSFLHNCFLADRAHNDFQLLVQTKNLSKQCTSKLLKKLIGSRNFDSQFGLAILNYFTKKEATNWIIESTKKYKYDFQRLYAITELGMMYFRQNNCTDRWNDICKLKLQCVWGKQIMEYGFSYKEAFRETPYDQKQLLLKLMSVPAVDVKILTKYCKDVKFDFQSCLKVYLKHVLLAWKPEFEIKTNSTTGEKEIIIKQTYKNLLNKCREIITLIENLKELQQMIASNIWDSINYYYYEVFLILITLMEENGVKPDSSLFGTYRTVFLFLSSYQRISKPQEFEKDSWHQLYPNEQSLPPISEYRLPFRLIFPSWCKSNNDPWKIIKHELNIQTYTKWFAVLDALQLDKNVLCTFAINQMTYDGIIVDESKTEWCIYLRNQKLLADVKSCIENISSLEMATASLYFVINHLPPGADQVTAAKLCFLHAKQWLEFEKSEKAENGFLKVQKKYLTISTTHILYMHNLGKPQYLQLVLKPTELINAVYNDPIIFQKNSGNIITFPDINKATEEISILHKIDIMKIRMELLEEWLQPENFIGNVFINESIVKQNNDDSLTEQLSNTEYENFQKACYIVGRNVTSFGPHLVNIVFDQDAEDAKPVTVRLRALQCLYAVTSETVLEQVTGKSIEKLRDLMNTLKFIMELERLGLTYSVHTFNSGNKIEIIKSLLLLKNSKAVCLTVKICRNFNVDNPQIWNEILSKMCTYKMIKELSEELPNLSDIYYKLDLNIFEKAWNTLLLFPLEKASAVLSEDQAQMIETSIKLINFCPIIDQINIDSIKSNCRRINREDLIRNLYNFNYNM